MKVKMNKGITVILLMMVALVSYAEGPQTTELREPRAVNIVEPNVPVNFARAKVSGKVEVSFEINEEGCPSNIRIENATHTEYANSVVNALRQWRYEGTDGSNVRYCLPVLFN